MPRKEGHKEAILDRRREVWSLRARGYSQRGIAEKLGITRGIAEHDMTWCAKNWTDLEENTRLAVQGQCLEALRALSSMVIDELERQRDNGQIVTTTDGRGEVIQTVIKTGLDPRAVSEAGRCVERAAKLMGITDGGIDAAAGPVTPIQINLPGPSTGAELSAQATLPAIGHEKLA